MKKLILKYKYLVIGLIISVFGYVMSRIKNLDLHEKLDLYFLLLENIEIDELLLIWLQIFLVFVIIQILVSLERKRVRENKEIYSSMLYAANHIIRNFIYQTNVIKLEAEENIHFDKNSLIAYEQSVKEAEILLEKLGKIEKIDENDIYESIKAEAQV